MRSALGGSLRKLAAARIASFSTYRPRRRGVDRWPASDRSPTSSSCHRSAGGSATPGRTARSTTAPHTFDARIDAEAWVVAVRRKIDTGPVGRHRRQPQASRSRSAPTRPAGWQQAGRRQTDQGPHPRALPARSWTTTCCRRSAPASSPRSSRRTSATWYAATLADRPTMRSHAYWLLRTIMASAVNDELIDANPAASSAPAAPSASTRSGPASVAELGVLTAAMPERLRLMVTLASWCALRFGEIVELRRGDIDLGARGDPHPPRRGAHRWRVHRSPHPRVTPVSATSRSRRTSSR